MEGGSERCTIVSFEDRERGTIQVSLFGLSSDFPDRA